jgi:hypothetical protein
MSQARRRLRSDVELPVPAQGSPLDLLFAQKEVESNGNRIGRLRSCSAKSHSLTTTSLGSGDGYCVHRLKSCRRVPGVPSYSSAVRVDLEPHRFPDTTCR